MKHNHLPILTNKQFKEKASIKRKSENHSGSSYMVVYLNGITTISLRFSDHPPQVGFTGTWIYCNNKRRRNIKDSEILFHAFSEYKSRIEYQMEYEK